MWVTLGSNLELSGEDVTNVLIFLGCQEFPKKCDAPEVPKGPEHPGDGGDERPPSGGTQTALCEQTTCFRWHSLFGPDSVSTTNQVSSPPPKRTRRSAQFQDA